MSETTTAPAATAETEEATTTDTSNEQLGESGLKALEVWKARAREAEKQAKANAEAAKRLAALEESQKSEQQKLADRAAEAERERDEARLEAMRTRVGMAKKLPADVIDLLKGDTEEELAAHADRLAEHFKASVRPSGPADQGPRGGNPSAAPRDQFAAYLKQQMGQ